MCLSRQEKTCHAIVGQMQIRPSMEKEGARTQSWQPLMRDLGSLMSCAYTSVGGYSGRQLSLSNTIFWFAYDISQLLARTHTHMYKQSNALTLRLLSGSTRW